MRPEPYAHVRLINMAIHNAAGAKAHLSQLLDAALKGEKVVVTRAGKPLVRPVPVDTPPSRVLGFGPWGTSQRKVPVERFSVPVGVIANV